MTTLENLVTIQLDKERHLRLTLKGMVEFEKLTGKNILKGLDLGNFLLEDLGALVWVCLIHEDRQIQLDDVLYMIDLTNLQPILEAVTRCIEQSVPKKEASPLAETPPVG